MQMCDKTLIQQVVSLYWGLKPALRRLATERWEGDAYPVF